MDSFFRCDPEHEICTISQLAISTSPFRPACPKPVILTCREFPANGEIPVPLLSIAYASEVSSGVSAERVESLTRDAARFNVEAGVTGVLLHDGYRFVQYIEGPEDGVEVVYGRILAATSHREIVELGRGRASIRRFPYWAMRLVPVVSAGLRDLIRQDWDGLRRYEASAGAIGSAMVQLAEIVTPQANS